MEEKNFRFADSKIQSHSQLCYYQSKHNTYQMVLFEWHRHWNAHWQISDEAKKAVLKNLMNE
jgi:hypothetical protein